MSMCCSGPADIGANCLRVHGWLKTEMLFAFARCIRSGVDRVCHEEQTERKPQNLIEEEQSVKFFVFSDKSYCIRLETAICVTFEQTGEWSHSPGECQGPLTL